MELLQRSKVVQQCISAQGEICVSTAKNCCAFLETLIQSISL